MFDVEIRDMPKRNLAALAHQGAYPEIGRTFQSLYAMIGSRGMFPQISHGVALYYHDPSETPEKDLMSYAAVTLRDGVDAADDFEAVEVTGGRSAVLTYKGPYAGPSANPSFGPKSSTDKKPSTGGKAGQLL